MASPTTDTRPEADPRPSPPTPRAPRGGRHRRPPAHPVLRWVLLILVPILAIPVLFFVVSVVGALRTHGNYSFKAKWADWLRAHHAEIVTKELEDIYFKANAAKKGGNLKGLNAIPTVQSTVPHAGPTTTLVPHLKRPSSVPLVVKPGTAGEGQWQPTGPVVGGQPGMYIAQFRADDIYTSQLASAVWIDPKLLRVRLVPGYQEPGGDWVQPHYITGPALPKIAAAFNGGFRFQDAHGGFYLDGRTAIPLVDGAASMVIYKDGRINIGSWGRDVGLTPDVRAVLQNLTLMVDNGVLDSRISHNDTSFWGSTLGGSIAVARSGIGVTKDGALVYVAGPTLTAKSLAESLQRVGAVRAMTLDINPEWVTFNLYEHPSSTNPSVVNGVPLYPQQSRPGSRYLSPEARDFFTISKN